MSDLFNRVILHWKTTAGGLLAVAGVVFSSVESTNPAAKWVLTASAIVAGLTGLLAKDS